MKRTIISMFVALLATVTVQAQQIAVVSSDGTTMYQTLAEAIDGAKSGSTIYLPSGGFQIADETKITKQVTIIGIGHKSQSENADGNTVISGNLFFNEGSSGSAVMGCYISGNVNIGADEKSVNNILVRYCNLNAFTVKSNLCTGTEINQNYIRSTSNGGSAAVEVTNNVLYRLQNVYGGIVRNNISPKDVSSGFSLENILNSTISDNILYEGTSGTSQSVGSNNIYYAGYSFGDECVHLSAEQWAALFVKNSGITPASDFHFTEDYQKYSNIGIYGGTGFSDSGMAPVPFIEAKDIPDKTDAAGMLKIKVRVKASE